MENLDYNDTELQLLVKQAEIYTDYLFMHRMQALDKKQRNRRGKGLERKLQASSKKKMNFDETDDANQSQSSDSSDLEQNYLLRNISSIFHSPPKDNPPPSKTERSKATKWKASTG